MFQLTHRNCGNAEDEDYPGGVYLGTGVEGAISAVCVVSYGPVSFPVSGIRMATFWPTLFRRFIKFSTTILGFRKKNSFLYF